MHTLCATRDMEALMGGSCWLRMPVGMPAPSKRLCPLERQEQRRPGCGPSPVTSVAGKALWGPGHQPQTPTPTSISCWHVRWQ